MQWAMEPDEAMKRQMLAFIEEHCRGLTLGDVRDWYDEALLAEPSEEVS